MNLERQRKETERKLKIVLLLCFLLGVLLCVLGILLEFSFLTILGCAEIAFAFILFCVNRKFDADHDKRVEAINEKYRQDMLKIQRKHEMYASGKWTFPTRRLYEKCLEGGVSELNSDFALQKAMLVATAIMNSEGVPSGYHELYCNKANINKLFESGALLKKESEAKKRLPQNGNLNEQEMRCVQMARDLRGKRGQDKRVYMLSRAISDIDDQIRKYREGQEAMKTLGMIYASSVSQTPKHDWAILGGIAEGIAGPGAGVAVAANAMIENQRIEEQNRRARAAATQLIGDLYSGRAKLDSSIGDLENEKKLLLKYREEAAYKVVLDGYTKEKLFKVLGVSADVRKLPNGKGLKLHVTFSNVLHVDVPEGVKVATDGTLNARIFFEEKLVNEVCVPLPVFGVECGRGGWESVDMYSDRYVEADGEYTVQFEPNDLWIIEI